MSTKRVKPASRPGLLESIRAQQEKAELTRIFLKAKIISVCKVGGLGTALSVSVTQRLLEIKNNKKRRVIRITAMAQLRDHTPISSASHCDCFAPVRDGKNRLWSTVQFGSHKHLSKLGSLGRKEGKLDLGLCRYPDKYSPYHQVAFCCSFSGSTDLAFLCGIFKKTQSLEREEAPHGTAGNCFGGCYRSCHLPSPHTFKKLFPLHCHWEVQLTLISARLFSPDFTFQITICLDTVNYWCVNSRWV